MQNDVEYRIASRLASDGGYLFNQAKVTEFDANPALVGNYLPQVPKHRGSVERRPTRTRVSRRCR